MIDAQPVVLAQHLVHPRVHEAQHGAGAALGGHAFAGLEELSGIQHRVVPRLALGVGAARRSPHQVRAQEQALPGPRILQGEADLQVPVELESQLGRQGSQLAMRVVDEELVEGIALDELRVLRAQRLEA